VSLVGQWIQEAKSKLADPGLVYPYHGQNRTRDGLILSKNSIVVTTYQVIASDAIYHAKSSGTHYCPPLEQVRWWRIICDEGHSLRGSQTQRSKAVLSIPGDHKWLVSGTSTGVTFLSLFVHLFPTHSLLGTPMNTSVLDLTNQFKFLGIEHPEELLRAAHSSARSKSGRHCSNDSGSMMTFVLGSIMMRHTQNMKYRGTSTTLMQLPKKVSYLDCVS
jgi:SWI/SNF-related matrix-associated actin-dependent regulator of chromatin subfamily A3